MADHSDFLALAREMISEDGRSVTFAKLVDTPVDSDKPWNGPVTPTLSNQVDVFAVFLARSGEADFGQAWIDVELFKSCEKVLLTYPPTTGEDLTDYNVVVDGSTRWRIKEIQELKPANLTCLFAMGVCR